MYIYVLQYAKLSTQLSQFRLIKNIYISMKKCTYHNQSEVEVITQSIIASQFIFAKILEN